MRYRLVKETEASGRIFWKVEYWHWFLGWMLVRDIDSMTCNNYDKAKALFEKLKDGATRRTEVIEEFP